MIGGRWMAATLLTLTAATHPGWAAKTLSWSESPENLGRGHADGVAVTRNGFLFAAPGLARIGSSQVPGDPAHVWAMIVDDHGNLYLGTGPDGQLLKITPTGADEVFFTVDEPMITALALTRNGDILAATAPGGRIYRIDPSGTGEVWCETNQRYVWALAIRADGRVFAATGEKGSVISIGDDGAHRTFFDSDESHIVSLAIMPDGSLLAGGMGAGLLYRIDDEGNALVVYDDELPEVSDLAIDDDGNIYAILVAAPTPETRKPAVRIQMPQQAQAGISGESVTESNEGPVIRGVIEGLPTSETRRSAAQQGRLVRIQPDGRAEILWRSTSDAPFALMKDATGRILFGTGEPGKIYRIDGDDDLALLTTLPEAQVTALARSGRAVIVATSNPARAYRLDENADRSGVFVSRTFDAGEPSRWGSIRWKVDGSMTRTEIYTRTGNSARPDETWSGWSPALAEPAGSGIVNPDGRYMQWRARFTAPRDPSIRLSSFVVYYEPYNRPPTLREFYLDAPGVALSGDATFRFATYDPDQDPVELLVEISGADREDWSSLGRPDEPSEDERLAGIEWQDDRFVMPTGELDEGDYKLRVTLDDQAGNPPGEAERIVARRDVRLIVDRTPPEIRVFPADGGGFELILTDAHSDIQRLELVLGDRVRYSIRPVDGLCDSPSESFRFELPSIANGQPWSARGIDTAGNRVEAPLVR